MSSLQFNERRLLEKILQMQTGYVSDFSDRTFREFVMEHTGIDIYTEVYEENGTSKANRLRTFWKKESDVITVALIEPLIEYALREKTDFDRELNARDENLFIESRKIVQRLKDEPSVDLSEKTESSSSDSPLPTLDWIRILEIVLNVLLVPAYLVWQFIRDVAKYAYQHLVQILGVALAVFIIHLFGVI